MRYKSYSTKNDVMKEFLIYGSELTDYGFPILPSVNCEPKESIDFCSSMSRSLKGHKNLNVNFYIDDNKFLRIWNSPDRYIEHLSCFGSVCGVDFTIDTQMPLVMQFWNKYRSMALDWYFYVNGITVIPNVNIMPYKGREWLLEGIPHDSTICCSSNGRIRSKSSRKEFCEGFNEMCDRLNPNRVILVGIVPDELNVDVEIINFDNRATVANRNLGGK